MRSSLLAFLGAAALASACSTSPGTGVASTTTGGTTTSGTGGTGTGGGTSTPYPAAHPSPPRIVSAGGPVLAKPVLVPIFFSNEDSSVQARITDFLSKLGATHYWAATTAEYGVGPATSAPPVVLTEAAPATIDDGSIQTWLAGKLTAAATAFPPPDASTVYVIHYPSTTTVTLQASNSCQSFVGYHGQAAVDLSSGAMDVPYVVVPECAQWGSLQGIDEVTVAESSALLNAVTDPLPSTKPAWGGYDQADSYWTVVDGDQAAGFCFTLPGTDVQFSDLPYTVQRGWSNKAVLAGHNPCAPALPNEVYFAAAPELPDTATIPGLGTVDVVAIPPGQSKTVTLDLFSDGDTGGPWTVEALDFNAFHGGQPYLSFSLDQISGQNGDKLHLTITRVAGGPGGIDEFLIRSTLGSLSTLWVGAVAD